LETYGFLSFCQKKDNAFKTPFPLLLNNIASLQLPPTVIHYLRILVQGFIELAPSFCAKQV